MQTVNSKPLFLLAPISLSKASNALFTHSASALISMFSQKKGKKRNITIRLTKKWIHLAEGAHSSLKAQIKAGNKFVEALLIIFETSNHSLK